MLHQQPLIKSILSSSVLVSNPAEDDVRVKPLLDSPAGGSGKGALRSRMHRLYVVPSDINALSFKTELRGLDACFFMLPEVPLCYKFTERIDFESLAAGLQRTLNRIPSLAGRLVLGKLALEISNRGSPGAMLEFAVEGGNAPPSEASADKWTKYFPTFTFVPMEPYNTPLCRVRLTHVGNGCVLAVSVSHLLVDGDALVKFLNILSYETGQALKSPTTMPSTNPETPESNRKVLAAVVPTDDDFRDEFIMSKANAVRLAVEAMVGKTLDAVEDFVIDVTEWEACKKSVSAGLGEGQWISSYEAIMSVALNCLAAVDGVEEMKGCAIVNMRSRSNLFAKNYFGVAISMHEFHVATKQSATETAWSLHQSLRSGLANPARMEKLVMLTEEVGAHKMGRLGVLNRLQLLWQWKRSVLDKNPVLNSWIGYAWFDLDFGTQTAPDFMRVPPEFRYRRHVHCYPRSPTEMCLRMELPPKQMKAFKAELRRTGLFAREGQSIV